MADCRVLLVGGLDIHILDAEGLSLLDERLEFVMSLVVTDALNDLRFVSVLLRVIGGVELEYFATISHHNGL